MEVSHEKYIARNNPVRIWVVKHKPLSLPNLQKEEMFLGAAKDIRESKNIIKGFDFRRGAIELC